MEDICYKTNPIKEAIARIDFLSPLNEIENGIPKQITEEIKKSFPVAETKEIIGTELQISNQKVQHNQVKTIEWNFFDKNRSKRACISQSFFFIDVNKYSTYEIFSADFSLIINSLFDQYSNLQVKRFGVRYINEINFSKGNPFDWKKILNNKLLTIFSVPRKKSQIARALHNLELNYGDYNLRFQYGMHNPDFPAQIKKKIFILDMDTYYNGILSKADIHNYFPKFHNSIQELFEDSITDDYRRILNGK